MFNLRLLQDLNLENADLRKQYYSKFVADDIEGAFRILSDNPQLASQVLTEENLNALVNALLTLENFYQIGVTDFLQNKLNEFQIDINNLIYIGQFLPTKTYVVNNFVMYQGRIFYCYRNTVAGILPTNESYWINLGLKGESGNAAMGVIYKGVWSASTSYSALDMVLHADNLYVARTANSNKNPTTSTADWFLASEFKTSIIHVSFTEPIDWQEGEIWFRLFKPYPNILWELILDGGYWVSKCACYGNGLFVISDAWVNFKISSDGINWRVIETPIDTETHLMSYGNGLFVAVPTSEYAEGCLTSRDGITWNLQPVVPQQTVYSMCYGNGIFVIMSRAMSEVSCSTSTDGAIWEKHLITNCDTNSTFSGMCYANGLFVAVGSAYSAGQDTKTLSATSVDGIHWNVKNAPMGCNDVCYGNGIFVAKGSGGCMTSPDGEIWTTRSIPLLRSLVSICYGDGIFVALDAGSNVSVATSQDGITWTANTIPNSKGLWATKILYGNGVFVVDSNQSTLVGKIEKV